MLICHTEVTTLVVPGLSDTAADILGMAGFLASISPDIPYHLSAYHPAWKLRDPPTDPSILSSLAEVARGKLRYVYLGNIVGEESDTQCPRCGRIAIRRRGYETRATGLRISKGRAECAFCGESLPIVAE
jgi:pyruvate formate lyase activating enzyme